MTQRMNIAKWAPEAYQHMSALEGFLAKSTLPATIRELVKLRVSQLNGCAFCVDMHSHDLRAMGETDERLFSVVTWREAPFFTEEERAALALAEEATRLGPEGVSDDVWELASKRFDEERRPTMPHELNRRSFVSGAIAVAGAAARTRRPAKASGTVRRQQTDLADQTAPRQER